MSQLHPISGTENADRKADVVFVHGVRGDAFATWRHGNDDNLYWPRWLAEDFPEIGVWSLGYAASPTQHTQFLGRLFSSWRDSGHGMSLPDRAEQVLDQLEQKGVGQRPILFIGHSLGGLVIKQVLRKSADAGDGRLGVIFKQSRGVLFLATPHTGVVLANLANRFREAFGPTVTIDDLRSHDAHLRDLYDWYRRHAPDVVETRTYFEQRPLFGALMIVTPSSAHPGVGDNPVPLDEDHISIAKPRDRKHQVYLAAKGLLSSNVLKPRVLPRSPVSVSTTPLFSARIPHQLPPAAHAFFGRKTQREDLAARLLARKNSAVVGPAGLGKTALAAAALRSVVGETHDSLAAYMFTVKRPAGSEGAVGGGLDRHGILRT